MKDIFLRVGVKVQTKTNQVIEGFKNLVKATPDGKDEGSFFTEPIGIALITVVGVLLLLAAIKLLLGNVTGTGSGGSGLLGQLETKLFSVFD